jgi:hypothetical protein
MAANLAGSFGHRNPKEMTMFTKSTKVLVAALVLAATSLTFVASASARPGQSGASWQGTGSLDICMTDDGYGRTRSCSAGGN